MRIPRVDGGVKTPRPSPESLNAAHDRVKRLLFKAQDALDRASGQACVADAKSVHWDYVQDQLAKAVCWTGEAMQAAFANEIQLRIIREANEVMEAADILLEPALADTPVGERPVQS